MTEITDLNPVDESNTSLTGNGITGGNFVSNFDNAMRGLLGLLGRLNSGASPISDAFTLADPADLTKRVRIDAGNVTAGQTRVFSMPDANLSFSANGASLVSAANYAAMRALLDLEAGTDFNAYSANLAEWSGIDPSANGASLVSAANYAAMRALLDLEAGTDFNAYSAALAAYPDPTANDADSLGIAGTAWSDLFLATGGVINWNSGSVTITDGGGFLTFGAGTSYRFSTTIRPTANDGGQLGTSSVGWSDLFLAIGGVVNFGQGDVLITHSTNQLAFTLASSGYTFDAAVLPSANDAAALGAAATSWADLFLASGGVVNWANGDVLITHSSNLLAFTGASSGYSFDAAVLPSANDAAALGAAATSWADLFLASGALINFANGNYTITHSSGTLTLSGALSIGTSNAFTAGTIELGAATDTTLSRGAAGFIAVEGNRVPSPASQASGDTLYRGSTEWERLAKGAAFQNLRMNSGATAPEWATAREVLTGNRTYYVRTDGSDSNTGLVNNSGGAFLTVQKAEGVIRTLDLGGFNVTVRIGNGTYTAGASINGPYNGGEVTYRSDSGTATDVTISVTNADCFTISSGATVTIQDLSVQTTTSGFGFRVQRLSVLRFGNINFKACATGGILNSDQASVSCFSNYAISGNTNYHLYLEVNSATRIEGTTVTLTGTPAFGSSFVFATIGAVLNSGSNTYSGSATGSRYLVVSNAVVNTNGGGASYFPGNAAGNATTGGIYS